MPDLTDVNSDAKKNKTEWERERTKNIDKGQDEVRKKEEERNGRICQIYTHVNSAAKKNKLEFKKK